jgi:hypothetical protein
MTFGILDLVDADGVDGTEFAMLQSKRDDVFHCVENRFPWSPEGFGCFLPMKAAAPSGLGTTCTLWSSALSVTRRNFLDDDRLTGRQSTRRME